MNSALILAAVSVLSAVSPDGRNEIRMEAGEGLSYSVWREGKVLLASAPVSLTVKGHPFSAEVLKSEPTLFAGTLETPLYKKASVSLEAKGCRAQLAGGYGVELVARNDGVAYRFTTDFAEDEVIVENEQAPLVFPDGKVSVWAGYPDVFPDADKTYSGLSNWEPVYTNLTAAAAGLKTDRMGVLPLVAEYADGTCLSVTESDQRDYPGWVFRGSGESGRLDGWFPREPVEEKCTGPYHTATVVRHDYIARTSGRRTYPWRLFQIAPCAAKLCEGDAVYALAEPCRLKDTDWIKPGLAQWEWWHAWVLTGVPFKSGVNTETYLHYIDFAAEHGVPYVIMDGGWSKDYRIMNAKPEIDLPKIAGYAAKKGVGIILWSPWAAFIGCQEEACRRYAEIGIRGFKLDGICRNDRYLTKYLEETARIAAKYRLVIDYHGVSKPSGLSRTYPNILTFEGVHGLENTKWEGDFMPICDFPKCDLTDYFCRMTAGPMDYTPGAMRNFATNEYRYSYRQPGSQGTRVRQMAMFTLFESPLQMLCDSPSAYRREAECFAFMSKVPTVWDETVGLDGKLADYALVARRKGDVWYVGAMTDWHGRELEIPTGFLKDGTWEAEIFADGPNADRDATDSARTVRTVRPGETLRVTLAPGGGWTARLTRSASVLGEQAVPEAHRLKTVMGRDYWTLLYSYFFNNPEWNAWAARDPQQRAYDNPELRELAVFRDCALRDFSCRRPPDVATGLAAYRTVKENFNSGNGHWEGLEACAKPDHPLMVTFSAKRSPLALAGKLDYDFDDFAKWKARHPNLTVFGVLSEWGNDVNHNIAYAFGKPKTNAVEEARRQAVRAFIGAIPSNRYDRVKLQRKYFDRQVELYYGDREHIGALNCSVLIGNLAAAWGAREIQLETTNTTSPGDNEYRWEVAAMFARGAARQFGIPWGWYTAIFMNGFNAADGKFVGDSVCGYPKRPEGGVSRSLNRRCWYYAYLNGANSLEQEGWHAVFLTRDASGKAVLSPRGEDFAAYHDFTAAHPNRGVPYTPVAVLVPFAQGYTSEGGYPWRNSRYGYTAGDQTVDAVFFSIVPGFERGAAMRKGGEFNLHNTPMAMMYDAISPDAPQKSGDLLATFRGYKALVVTGDYADRTFERTLEAYEREGGRVIRIDPKSLPPVGKGTVGEIWSGRRAFPEVAAKLKALQDELFPVKVSGDCQYGLNRTKSGWWLWCFNNRGVTKFADREQVVDPSAASSVTVDLGRIRAKSVRELLSAREVPLSGGSFSHVIPAGDLAVFEIK